MNVNEYERLTNITFICKVEKQRFYCYSTFHSHSRVCNNDSFLKISVKRAAASHALFCGSLFCLLLPFLLVKVLFVLIVTSMVSY